MTARTICHDAQDRAEGEKIRAVALALSRAPNQDDTQLSAAAVDRLYNFLSVLDNKANALMAANALNVAIIGILIIAPLQDFKFVVPATSGISADFVALTAGLIAVGWSGVNLLRGLHVFDIRWGFMQFVTTDARDHKFDNELFKLACEAALRQRTVAGLYKATAAVSFWSAVAVILSCGRYVF